MGIVPPTNTATKPLKIGEKAFFAVPRGFIRIEVGDFSAPFRLRGKPRLKSIEISLYKPLFGEVLREKNHLGQVDVTIPETGETLGLESWNYFPDEKSAEAYCFDMYNAGVVRACQGKLTEMAEHFGFVPRTLSD